MAGISGMLLASGLGAQEPERSVRIFALDAWQASERWTERPNPSPLRSDFDIDWDTPTSTLDLAWSWTSQAGRDHWLDALSRLTSEGTSADDRRPKADLELDETGRWLLAYGTDRELERVARALTELERLLLEPVTFRVTVLHLPGDFDCERLRTTIDSEHATSLRNELPVLADHSARLTPDQTFHFADERISIFVKDTEAEGARGVRIADPRCDFIRDGIRVGVQSIATPDPDHRLLVVEFLVGRRDEEIAAQPSNDTALGIIQAPVLRGTYGRFEAPARRGEALCCWSTGRPQHGPNFLMLIESFAENSREQLEAEPARARIEAMRFDVVARNWSTPTVPISNRLGAFHLYHGLPRPPREEVIPSLLQWLRIVDWGSERQVGPYLLSKGVQQADSDRAMFAHVTRESLQRFGSQARIRATNGLELHSATILGAPTRRTAACNLVRGLWTYEVGDYFVELSMGASPASPSSYSVFDGMHFFSSVDEAPNESTNDSWLPRVQATIESSHVTPTAPLRLRGLNLGTLHHHDHERRRYRHHGVAADGIIRWAPQPIRATHRPAPREPSQVRESASVEFRLEPIQ
ncbi:MAG: hypothetical protein AAF196_10770 [Planctomycetota bacterium]